MKVVGIDPGTRSFDLCGLEDGQIFIDRTMASAMIGEEPEAIIEVLKSAAPIDFIVGPSGYGLPLMHISEVGDTENFLMLLVRPDDSKIIFLKGMSKIIGMLKDEGFNVYFAPGVVHMPTVPEHRKINKIDMGTADKLCCTVLAVHNQARHLGISYEETSFILVELGFGYNAVVGVENGQIVDGIGGTMSGPGFQCLGGMDSELAYLMDGFSKNLLFSGGVVDITGKKNLTPEEFANTVGIDERYNTAWKAFMEGVEKSVISINVSVGEPKEILISGRLSKIHRIYKEVSKRLSYLGEVRKLEGFAEISKEAAQGAALIADGLADGKYSELVETLRIREAKGTVLDYIYLGGIGQLKRRYGIP
ncbi:MAG: DUF1464 domain-containing protein [Nitrososphaeria archaeon]|nr:DUF1464 domain-containing protein [Nitrososphaeria archaeon]NIN51592.1 DUF1464 domain-containing protein [Nitrososphaeria archaeon]NIQ32077.1 DUF1464 domain-containing protein [Nitrososphaeria archaeon]